MNPRPSTKRPPAIGYRTRVGKERRKRTEARIIEAAMRVFATKGPDAVVIDDLIREAGIARGTFYNYFTRTEEVLSVVSRALEDQLVHAIEHAIAGLSDPVDRLSTGLRLWLRWAQGDPTGCGFVVQSRFRGALVEKQLAADLSGGLAAGALDFDDILIARDVVVGGILEAMRRMLEEDVATTYPDDVVAMLLRGLGVRPRRVAKVLEVALPVVQAFRPGNVTAPSSPR